MATHYMKITLLYQQADRQKSYKTVSSSAYTDCLYMLGCCTTKNKYFFND